MAKLPQSLLATAGRSENKHAETMSKLTKDFMNGCAADFACKVTEYCLFKHGVEDIELCFHVGEESDGGFVNNSTGLDPEAFYACVDTARRLFRKTHLFSKRDPLKILREELPGSVGVGLARMWKLTGGENYSDGRGVSEDGQISHRPGDFVRFLKHVEESCLSMCGFPFKRLDKKSEKQLLFARKKELQSQLQDSSCGKDVTELSIMLLFQQVKGMAVCGQYLTSIVLDILVSDKKLPHSVSTLLRDTSIKIQRGEELCDRLIAKVKLCGLSRDISSHVVEDS